MKVYRSALSALSGQSAGILHMQNLWIAFRRFLRSRSLPKAPNDRRWIVFDDGRVAFLARKDYAMHREQVAFAAMIR